MQIKLGLIPEFENKKDSYLDDKRKLASGTVYEITKEQYASIETLLKKYVIKWTRRENIL